MRNAAIRSNELVITETPGSRDGARTGRPVKAAGVINSLNRINFHGGHVFVRLRHVWNNSFVTVAAEPEPGDLDVLELEIPIQISLFSAPDHKCFDISDVLVERGTFHFCPSFEYKLINGVLCNMF